MEQLELNKNDSMSNVSKLHQNKQLYRRSIAGILVLCSLYSGSLISPVKVKATEIESTTQTQMDNIKHPNMEIEIPECYKWKVAEICHKDITDKITIGDLQNASVRELKLRITDNSSLEWLNYVKSINELDISISTDDYSALKEIEKINGATKINISSPINIRAAITNEDFKFIKNTKTLKELDLFLCSVEKGFLEELKQLDILHMKSNSNYATDYSKLTHLKELDLRQSGPYDIAADITREDYDTLKNAGVKITFSSKEDESTYIEICNELEQVVESLKLNETSTDQEKLDAILIHVLDKLTYDKEVSKALRTNTEHTALTQSFYIDGYLYGALEKESSICGNYAAYVQALAKRVDLQAYFIESTNHAWNLIMIDGEEYYVDATWMDGDYIYVKEETKVKQGNATVTSTTVKPITAQEAIASGRASELDWYMADPENYPYNEEKKESHEEINLPKFIPINPKMAEENENTIIDNNEEGTEETKTFVQEPLELTEEDEFEVSIGDKKWIITSSAAVGIMMGLGGAVALSNSKKRKNNRRNTRQDLDDMFSDFDSKKTTTIKGKTNFSDEEDFFSDMFNEPSSSKYSRRR